MKIQLTKDESENIFHTSLCNALGTGYMAGYGLELSYDRGQYKISRDHLEQTSPNDSVCYEDVLMQILRDGGELTFIDQESDGDTHSITLKDVHKRVKDVNASVLINFQEENDDADDADAVLQTVFFNEIIFG